MMDFNSMKKWIMAGGLAISMFAGSATAQVIGGDVAIDGSNDDVIFLGGEIDVRGQINGDIKGVAGSIRVNADVTGSVQLAGGEIDVAGTIGEDLDLAGGDLQSRSNVSGDANFAGGDIEVSGAIGGMLNAAACDLAVDLDMAGGFVETSGASRVGGTAEVVGGEVHLAGEISGRVEIEGGEIHLSGVFLDDVDITAEEVYILDGTRIAGALTVQSRQEPVIADGASFGSYDYTYSDFNFGAKDWENVDYDVDFNAPTGIFVLFIPGAVFLLAALACLVAPGGTASVARRFRERPVVSGFIGFIGFALSPIFLITMTVLLAITVVGILLIPIMWIVFWPFMLLCMGFGAVAIGDMAFNRRPDEKTLNLGMRLLSTFVVVAVFAALGAVPVLGVLTGFVLLFIGFGAWLLSLGKRRDVAPALASDAAV